MSKAVPPGPKLLNEAKREAVRSLKEQWELLAPFRKLIREILRPGTATRDAWDFMNPHNSEDVRIAAAVRLAGKAKNPIYYRRWKTIEDDIYRHLSKESPPGRPFDFEKAFQERMIQVLPLALDTLLDDKWIDEWPKEQIPDYRVPMEWSELRDPHLFVDRLKRILDADLPADILGPDWRSELERGDLEENEDHGTADDDPMKAGIERIAKVAKLSKVERQVADVVARGGKLVDSARALGITPGAARQAYHRAKKKIFRHEKRLLGLD
jgi:hypothetical protein